ncbi:MAG: hypothetical protein QOH90_893 [Actinomycetota bacterium]|jgi:hypothetical protein|nr:hypothetical protein [Actinomycetota bacterium]
MMKRLRSEAGVAMVTVLFIGAALTAVTSVAAFATIQEFRGGLDDRKAAEALSYAEAGIDRMIQYMKSGRGNFNTFNRAGCADPAFALPPGLVGNGQFSVNVTVYDPFATNPADRFPPAACSSRPTSPHPGQANDKTYFVITSTGTHPSAVRKVRQIVALSPIGMPVGMYAENFVLQAHPTYNGMTMQANGFITDRKNDSFVGNDPYYKIGDFFPSVSGKLLTDPIPAAAHAGKGIYLNNSSTPEFTGPGSGTKNCAADRTTGRSIWDSDGSAGSGSINSGCSTQDPTATGFPSTSKFTPSQPADPDHAALKDAALSFGVYCSFPGVGGTGTTDCYKEGVASGSNYVQLIQQVAATTNNFIVYVEFRAGTPTQNNFNWDGNVWGCNLNPALNHSVVVDIKNGGFYDVGAGGDMLNGALIMDGDFNTTGKFIFNGTFISHGSGTFGSSSETVTLDPCWIQNFPASFYKVVPGHWAEVDR